MKCGILGLGSHPVGAWGSSVSLSVAVCEREHLPPAGCQEQTDSSAPAPEEAGSPVSRQWTGAGSLLGPQFQAHRPFSTLPEAQTHLLSRLFSVTPTGDCSLVSGHTIVWELRD